MKNNQAVGHTWTENVKLAPCAVTAYRYTRYQPAIGRRIKNRHWVLDYSVTGSGRYRAGSKPGPWRPRPSGQAHLYAPGTPYWEDLRKEKFPAISTWITFTGGDAAGLMSLTGREGYAVISDSSDILQSRLDMAGRIAREQGDAGFWQVQGILMDVIGILLTSVQEENGCLVVPADRETAAGSLGGQVRRYLQSHLGDKISLKEIAEHCSVSLSSLTHQYKAETGETPWTTLQYLRTDLARIMLIRGERLQTIADQAGFSDEYHLSRSFKRITGMAPRDYLKNI